METQHRFDFDELDLRIEPASGKEEQPADCSGHTTCNGTGTSLRTGTVGC